MSGRAAILGGGVIGAGWAARFALMGWDVAVHDPALGAEAAVHAVIDRARTALPALYDRALPAPGTTPRPKRRSRARTGSRKACPSGWS